MKQHINPDGSIGGLIDETAKVSKNTFLDQSSIIRDYALITGQNKIGKNCVIKDSARIHNSYIGENNIIYHYSFIGNSSTGSNNIFHHSAYIYNSIISDGFVFGGDCILEDTMLQTSDKILTGTLNNSSFTITKHYFHYLKYKTILTPTEQLYKQILLIMQKTL